MRIDDKSYSTDSGHPSLAAMSYWNKQVDEVRCVGRPQRLHSSVATCLQDRTSR
jgi:hypothetical protein